MTSSINLHPVRGLREHKAILIIVCTEERELRVQCGNGRVGKERVSKVRAKISFKLVNPLETCQKLVKFLLRLAQLIPWKKRRQGHSRQQTSHLDQSRDEVPSLILLYTLPSRLSAA